MKPNLRQSIARGALACALLAAPSVAFAQDAEDAQEENGTDVDNRSQNVIVVTAQGRSQSLADVPIAVSAISAEMLEQSGTTDIRELNQIAPSLLVSSTGNEANGSARIRGIGTVGAVFPLLNSQVVLHVADARTIVGHVLGLPFGCS